ncbi:MAG: hypothetical protein IJ142_07910 [Bacteroidaceae bacterium]|nr:hypothetical protein [Bacteroidaceae bacterium]
MRKLKKSMLAATLVCGTTMGLTSCSDKQDNPAPTEPETEYPNKKITNGNYDKALAVKCVNGTFVGKKAENIIPIRAFRLSVSNLSVTCAGRHLWT